MTVLLKSIAYISRTNSRNFSAILPAVSAFHAKPFLNPRPNIMVNKGIHHFPNISFMNMEYDRLVLKPKVSSITYLSSQSTSNDEGSSSEVTPTWTYVPYKPSPPSKHKRSFSSKTNNFIVPKTVNIPLDQVEMTFVRSSGAGGQNVNKVNTKVELRFHVKNANWIPMEVRERLTENEHNRINKEGFMTLSSQEYRTQNQNREDVIQKLRSLIMKAYPRPKIRKTRKGLTKAQKEKRKQAKRFKSQVKENRKRVDF